MSVNFYTEPFFKGLQFSLDIGKYHKHNLQKLTIGSMIINDNVEVIVAYEKNNKLLKKNV